MMKRKHPRFNVPNFGAPNRKRVRARWRRQRGIDNKKRVGKRESGASPSIGYKNPASVRYARPDGTFEVLVSNMPELVALIGAKSQRAVRLSHSLSVRKRLALQELAESSGIRIVNRVSR